MSESILRRVSRIINAKLEDAVDRMERSGSDSVMRESIREVDHVIEQVQSDHEMATTRRLQAVRHQKTLHEKISGLTDKAKYAVAEGREDLAEAALNRQLSFEEQAGKLDAVWTQATEDEARLGAGLEVLRARKQEMEEAMAAFLASQRDAAPSEDGATQAPRGVERRVHRAEQAFDRAIANAGGDGFSRADGDTIRGVAEIDVMQKRATVTARLSALKQDVGAV